MEIHNVIQGTPDWHALRAKFYKTASRAPAMMNDSKYQKREALLKEISTGKSENVSSYTQKLFDKGHETELKAKKIVERMIDDELYPVTGTLGDLLASMDGQTMCEEILFEHKLLNMSVVASIAKNIIEPNYYWQLEQQLYVSGAEKVIFCCSDGTEDNFHYMEYVSVPERRAELLAGWEQFDKDLADYIANGDQEENSAIEQEALAALPALAVKIIGSVSESNLDEYEEKALAFIDTINTDLVTDSDFATAKETVKGLKNGELTLKETKEAIISGSADINAVLTTIDVISAAMRDKRLKMDKLVVAEEKARKSEITSKAQQTLTQTINEHNHALNDLFAGVTLPLYTVDFVAEIKGKRTLKSMRSACELALQHAQNELNGLVALYKNNIFTLKDMAPDNLGLFADIRGIIGLSSEAFIEMINDRLDSENQRLEAEREKIRTEEKQKAEAEAERKIQAAKVENPAVEKEITKEEIIHPRTTSAKSMPRKEMALTVDDQLNNWKLRHGITQAAYAELMSIIGDSVKAA